MERKVGPSKSWQALAKDGTWWAGVVTEARRLVEGVYDMGPEMGVGTVPASTLAEYGRATSYLEDGYLELRGIDEGGGGVYGPSAEFLEECELRWPEVPWTTRGSEQGHELMQDVAALAAATSCAHARMDEEWADDHFQERMMVGEDDQREVWRLAKMHEPLLERVPEDVRKEAEADRQHDEALGGPLLGCCHDVSNKRRPEKAADAHTYEVTEQQGHRQAPAQVCVREGQGGPVGRGRGPRGTQAGLMGVEALGPEGGGGNGTGGD